MFLSQLWVRATGGVIRSTAVVLGLNGAGKTTLMLTLAGVPTPERVARGIALVPEGRRVFGDLTVEQNLLLGGFSHRNGRDRPSPPAGRTTPRGS